MAAVTTAAVGATAAAVSAASAAGAFGGDEESNQSSSQQSRGIITREDAQRIGDARAGLGRQSALLQRDAGLASQQYGQDVQNFREGRFGARENSLLSQLAQRQRSLQSARQRALASTFGAGSNLANILGAQGQLQSDLGLNQARFTAAEQQGNNLGVIGQGLQNQVGLRQQAFNAANQDLSQAINISNLRAGNLKSGLTTASTTPSLSDRLSGVGTGLVNVAKLFNTPQAAQTPGINPVGGK